MHLQFDALQSSLSFGDSPKPDFYSQIMSELIIEAGRAEKNYWRDLWRYRELFYFLAWRDILVRYKQTVIGVAWAVIHPFLTTVIFTIIFSRIAKLPSARPQSPYASARHGRPCCPGNSFPPA